jgi:hypothetical protein
MPSSYTCSPKDLLRCTDDFDLRLSSTRTVKARSPSSEQATPTMVPLCLFLIPLPRTLLCRRYYYSCKRDRHCPAKKKVQQQDGSSEDTPVFEVTYVNDHTCHHAVAHGNDEGSSSQKSLPAATTTTGQQPSCFKAAANPSSALFGRIGAEENEAIVACLATVISGTAPPPPSLPAPGAELGTSASDDPPQQLAGVQPPIAYDGSMVAGGAMPMMDTGFWWDHPSYPFCPAEVIMDLCDDTVRPQYYT